MGCDEAHRSVDHTFPDSSREFCTTFPDSMPFFGEGHLLGGELSLPQLQAQESSAWTSRPRGLRLSEREGALVLEGGPPHTTLS